ncbi:MAG: murein hydrolase activator EnvC family protein [Candidatus Kapaibacterium sp.]
MLIAITAQPSVNASNEELRRLRSSIEQTRAQIHQLTTKERQTRRSLSMSQRQRMTLRNQILQLESSLRGLQDSVSAIQALVQQKQSSIRRSEQRWQELTRSMFRYQRRQQGRAEYSRLPALVYQRTTGAVSSFRNRMTIVADSLQNRAAEVGSLAQQQQNLLVANQSRRVQVDKTIQSNQKDLAQVVQSKSKLMEELRAKQASARRIAGLIQSLVRKEQEKRRSEARSRVPSTGGRAVPDRTSVDAGPLPQRGAFSRNSLPWPTSSRAVAQGYGMYRNPQTGTTLENPGIDIRSSRGSGVNAVAQGRVSTVTWLPGYGSLVIVDHQNGFRTVYANLASVRVANGSSVQAGSSIGTSGTSMDGDVVHFEVWNGSARINPLSYLR